MTQKEGEFIVSLMKSLKINPQKLIADTNSLGVAKLIDEVKSINNSQTVFLVFLSMELLNCNGRLNKNKLGFTYILFEKVMKINKKRFDEISDEINFALSY
jgi:hypothetical protein